MAKIKVVTLEEAIELKQTIQDLLTTKRSIFKMENCFSVKSERNYDLKKVLKDIVNLSDWFVLLKLKIQGANLIVPDGEDLSIASLVYTLSETKSDIITFQTALNKTYWKEGLKVEEGSEITYQPLYKKEKIEDWLATLQKKYYHIEGELTRLNRLITIELPFDSTDLN